MSLVETRIEMYRTERQANEVKSEVKRRKDWEVVITCHHNIIIARLGVPLCNELELTKPDYTEARTRRFPCKVFDLPCTLTVTYAPSSTRPNVDAHLMFNTEVDGKDVFNALLSSDTIGKALHVLKAKIDNILRPLELQKREWYPYYYYELTYAIAYQADDGSYADIDIVNVMREAPDENGWYHVLNPKRYPADPRMPVRLEKFTNVVKIARMLAERPDNQRDSAELATDEETGQKFQVLKPITGVERIRWPESNE